MRDICTPIPNEVISELDIGGMVTLSGYIYTGRDAILPKIVKLAEEGKLEEREINLEGSVIFHTAVSIAGVGPTSSNKPEIESSFASLSNAGVKIHLGKGAISHKTIETLDKHNAVFAIIPPVTALLNNKTLEQKVVAFPELGMEAMYLLKIDKYPIIIAAAHGKSIY
jgi:fumarate hydratase subunit beta